MKLAEQRKGNLALIDGGRLVPIEAARRWCQRGYHVIPIPFRQKKPTIDGWQNLRLQPDDLPRHFGSAPSNLGLLLGEPFGVTDVDLDCPEALRIWQTFAPPTSCVFGHQSKPFSHWLFHMDPPGPSLKFVDPVDKATLLELRCLSNDAKVGRQTVIPPSTHKDSGDAIQFESRHDGDPSNVDADVLVRAVKRTAAACVLARHYPPAGGGRHDTELALSGVLARAGWSEDAAKMFVLATYTACPSHDQKAVGRVAQAVEDSFRKLAEDTAVTGAPKLASLIDKRAVDAALEWLEIDGGPSVAVDSTNWRDHLILNKRDGIIPCAANVMTAVLYAKEWSGVLNFNTFACRVESLAPPPWTTIKVPPFNWGDEDDVQATVWMQHQGMIVSKAIVGEAIQTVAREHPFHPVRQYFESLKWDGIKRIDDWLLLYLGAADSDYTRAVASRFLIGGVARVFEPGCKNDCAMVLEGPQGALKSTALKVLGDPWFTDSISDLGSKDSKMEVHGVLIVEIAELDAMQKSEVSRIKAFMSCSNERYRPPYFKYLVDAPRDSVFAGSVNPGIPWLKDPTGGRRFWPVVCRKIDIDSLRRDKDMLWAEAVERYHAGATWWLDTMELTQEAEAEQSARFDTDPWHGKVAAFIEDRPSVSIVEILDQCIQKPTERQTQADKNRVARCLRVCNWTERQVRDHGTRERRYFPPDKS